MKSPPTARSRTAPASPPLILISPDYEPSGVEFSDPSLSLSLRYPQAVAACGGVPLVMPTTGDAALVGELVRHADGILLTGGDDLDPELYGSRLPADVKAKARQTPDGGARDRFELLVVAEVLRQRKPLLAICRGHQLLNVALGGSLFVDLPTQRPAGLQHARMDCKTDPVHDLRLARGSLLARLAGGPTMGVNSTHHQAVRRVAASLRAVAKSPDGIVEAVEDKHPGALAPFLLGVQFHPERMMDRHPPHRAIFAAFIAACAGAKQR
jgi:putative glutamine amidotransferase